MPATFEKHEKLFIILGKFYETCEDTKYLKLLINPKWKTISTQRNMKIGFPRSITCSCYIEGQNVRNFPYPVRIRWSWQPNLVPFYQPRSGRSCDGVGCHLWVTYGFLAIVTSMFGDFQYLQMFSTNFIILHQLPLISIDSINF